jgi:hypothetical protein
MKRIVVIMLIAAALTAAETLWENPYDSEGYKRTYASWSDWVCMDDFTLDESASIETFTCWGASDVWECDFLVAIFANWWDWPGNARWSEVVSAELTWVENNIKRVDIEPLSPPSLSAGTYWIEFYSLEEEFDWAVGYDGNFRVNYVDTGDDGFFGVYGEYTPAVAETTWGAIKALSR